MAFFLGLLVLMFYPITCLQARTYSLSPDETNSSSKLLGNSRPNLSTSYTTDHWSAETTTTISVLKTSESVVNVLNHTENGTLLKTSLSASLHKTYSYHDFGVPIGRTTSSQNTDVLTEDVERNVNVRVPARNAGDLSDHTDTSQSSLGLLGDHAERKDTVSGLDRDRTFNKVTGGITSTRPNPPTSPAPVLKRFARTSSKTGHRTFRSTINACSPDNLTLTTSYDLTLEILVDPDQIEQPVVECVFTAYVSQNHYMNLTVDQLTDTFNENLTIRISEVSDYETPSPTVIDGEMLKNTSFSLFSFNPLKVRVEGYAPFSMLRVTLHYRVQKGPYMRTLPSSKISADVTCVMSPGFMDGQSYPHDYDGEFVITITAIESLMISFSQIYIAYSNYYCLHDFLLLTELPQKKNTTFCGESVTDVMIYHSSLRLHFRTNYRFTREGFKMLFTILPRAEEPTLLPGKVFNCSVPNFHRFKPLMSCNTAVECEGGEDEQGCSYHSDDCGDGFVNIGTKCYRVVRPKEPISWTDAKYDCIRHGQTMVTFGNSEEFEQYLRLLHLSKNMHYTFFGAQTVNRRQAASIATLYRHVWQWADGWTAFSVQMNGYKLPPACAMYDYLDRIFRSTSCNEKNNRDYVCVFNKPNRTLPVGTVTKHDVRLFEHSANMTWSTAVNVVQCPSGHVTRDFLSCDLQAECRAPDPRMFCEVGVVKMPMFQCGHSQTSLPYTLVCDHVQHCLDNSDEDFCLYPNCLHGLNRDSQCILDHQLCDRKLDSYDGSDETCQASDSTFRSSVYPPG